MKIVFLCGSFEPGRDGVGDYTRRLAVELIKQGYQTAVVALNDSFIKAEYSNTQFCEGVKLPVLRVPSTTSVNKRFKRAKEFINGFNPDWLSLQFVPYSFQVKGLLYTQIKLFKYLIKERSLHIMVHEAWIGKGPKFNLKNTLYSALQKFTVEKLFKSLKPKLMHTHIPFYFHQFRGLGWIVKELPLFSNIPLYQLKKEGVNEKRMTVGFFSQMEITDSILKFINGLRKNLDACSMHLEILLFGGSEARANTCKRLLEVAEPLTSIVVKGHLDNKELSLTLQECDLGITPVPRHAVGKSGSVAAFLAHGIPVAAPNIHHGYMPDEIGFFNSILCSSVITNPDKNLISIAAETVVRINTKIELSTIAKTFISDLKEVVS